MSEQHSNTNIKQNIGSSFKLPIMYNAIVKELDSNIASNLELTKTNEENIETKPIYEYIFNPSTEIAKQMMITTSKYYTTNIHYLKDTQSILKLKDKTDNTKDNYKMEDKKEDKTEQNINLDNVANIYNDIVNDTGFCSKYMYVDWDFARFLNNNPHFLQIMSVYNILSPLLSLCLPIIVMILPFFIIKFNGLNLSISQYINVLKSLIATHAITKIFTDFNNVDFGQKLYLLLSCGFYVFSIYQNILTCIRFYSNIKKMQNQLCVFKQYIKQTITKMDDHLMITSKLNSYNDFNKDLSSNKLTLTNYYNVLDKLELTNTNFNLITQIGEIMCVFYKINNDTDWSFILDYSFGFNGYLDLLDELKTHINSGKLNETSFVNETHKDKDKDKDKDKSKCKAKFKQLYYPKFIMDSDKDTNIVKNDVSLSKNMIVSGPNASGKTTLLKSVFINILLSQQFGYGCFDELNLVPYTHFHCYLNIPDTSGRDSLFQAEAKRCKSIMSFIKDTPEDENHFAILDELYSGTNPDDAVDSAFMFIQNITDKPNVNFMLTTHYIKLCKRLRKTNNQVINYNMTTNVNQDKLQYTYELEKGISKIIGGVMVLRDIDEMHKKEKEKEIANEPVEMGVTNETIVI